jgi:spermidine/putrescine transport system permease protein
VVPGRRASGRLLGGVTALVTLWLYLPVVVMVVFSFNDTTSRLNFSWQGFTTRWYRQALAVPDLTEALVNSLVVASATAVVGTVVGGTLGYALARTVFRGRRLTEGVLVVSVAAPEVVLGAALLSLLVSLGLPAGLTAVFVAHVMFCIAYVATTVRARAAGADITLEDAAADLGADPWAVFRLVTLPQLAPGLIAAGGLAFLLSFDDFVITSFLVGSSTTLPVWIYSAGRFGIPPQVNVLATMALAIALVAVVAWNLRRPGRR